MQQPYSQTAPAQPYINGGGGSGTTNQQKLKSHVLQFVGKIRKDSDIFYRQFAMFCKNHRETEKWNEFHHGIGELIRPFGDLTNDINKLLHSSFQYDLQFEYANTTLRSSEIGVDGQPEGEKKRNGFSNPQLSVATNQKEVVREKFSKICQIIKRECPNKMNEFVNALQQNLIGKEDQLRLFVETCSEFFGEDQPIYQKVLDIFKDQFDHSKSDEQGMQEQILNSQMAKGSNQDFHSRPQALRKKNYQTNSVLNQSSQNQNSLSFLNKDSQLSNALSQSKNQHTPDSSLINQHNNYYRVPSTRGGDVDGFPTSINRMNIPGLEGQEFQQKNYNFQGATRVIHEMKNLFQIFFFQGEQNFLYLIDNHMDSMAFMNMLKLLYLYVESIITSSEMVQQGSYLLKGFQNSDKFIDQLKDLVECRESSRRKATPYFKPLNDLDFNNHSRFTHSYVEMPRFYPKHCSNSTELTKSVLNTSIVTVPQGTEHVTFSIMRKNQYEEQLFKSEDEKYEFDHHIQMYKRTIKILESVELCEDLQESRRLMQLALDLKIIPFLYKNGSAEQQEICEILLNNPKKTVTVTLERVKTKLREIEDAKGNQAKKQWHEVAEKNFHRSLDHRSFIFKRHDRKFTLGSRFEKEPEFRNKALQKVSHSYALKNPVVIPRQQTHTATTRGSVVHGMKNNGNNTANANGSEEGNENPYDFETDPSCYFQFLNTFQGTTNIEKCFHQVSEQFLYPFDSQKEPKKIVLPMMVFVFEDQNICEDTFSLLMHYMISTPMNAAEREKIRKTVQIVLKGLFGFSFSQIEQSDVTLNENKTIKVVTDIENKIFEKIYAYLRPITRDEDNKEVEEQEQDEEEKEDKIQQEDQDEQDHKLEKESAPTQTTKGKKIGKSPSRQYLHKRHKDDMETEDDKKRNNKQVNLNYFYEITTNLQQGNSESSLDEMLDEDGSREAIREMSYWQSRMDENIFLPKCNNEEMQTFYGTKCLYIFLRFFYVLYERLYKAAEISKSFEDNEKTKLLSEQEKSELSKERYSVFKSILIGSLKTRDTKYEDYLRSIFGRQAFLLFTIDKTLQSTTKSLQALASDELSTKLLSLYVNFEDFKQKPCLTEKEEIIFARINKIVLDSTVKQLSNDQRYFFRFTRQKSTNILYLNYIDSYYKNWEIEQLQKTKDYFREFTTTTLNSSKANQQKNCESLVYLSRNKRKNADKQAERQIIQSNNIEYITYTNTNHILSSNNGKEDILIATKRKHHSLEEAIHVEMTKKIKFDKWYENKKDTLIQFKPQN